MRAVNKLPIGRYIALVGSLLLAIFFIADWYLPMAPLQSVTSPEVDKPIIRIKSDRKWPERVVFDTSAPAIVPQKSPVIDPAEPGKIGSLDKYGDINVLSLDVGTSKLAQGNTAQTIMAEAEKFAGAAPAVTVFNAPV